MRKRRQILVSVIAVVIGLSLVVSLAAGAVLATNYKHIGRLVRVVSLIRTQYLTPVTGVRLVDGAIRGMVSSLKDPYSSYMDASEFRNLTLQIQGTYGGIGIVVGMNTENRLVVITPFKGTPADRAGILSGDLIARIDGRDTTEMSMDAAVNMMLGKPGTSVTLTVYRKAGDKLLTKNLIREKIEIPSVEGRILPQAPEIAYIRLYQFNSNTGEELGKMIRKLEPNGFKGIILDLRGNPGGDFNAAVNVASYFVPEGPVVRVVDRSGKEEVYQSQDMALGLPLVTLVNEGSASASEIVAGAIKDSHSGQLLGTKTFGKGVVQTIFSLDNSTGVKLTTAKYLTPNRHDINKKGIVPDIVVKPSSDPSKDVQLDAAVGILRKKI